MVGSPSDAGFSATPWLSNPSCPMRLRGCYSLIHVGCDCCQSSRCTGCELPYALGDCRSTHDGNNITVSDCWLGPFAESRTALHLRFRTRGPDSYPRPALRGDIG